MVRPTTDRVRESLFQVLEARYGIKWEDTRVLDTFAGSGALGMEALSRGASRAVFVEKDSKAAAVLQKNLEACRLGPKAQVVKGDIFRLLARQDFQELCNDTSLVFADPPYEKNMSSRFLEMLADFGSFLSEEAILVIEESKRVDLGGRFSGKSMEFCLEEDRGYGAAALWFYSARPEDRSG